jgi:MFS family permease
MNSSPPYPKESYSWSVIAVLLVVYIFAFMDRQILNLLVDPIKADLNITDTQISYLSGLAFAVFYTFFGIPIGRLVDSGRRVTIIAVGLAVWSFFTMLCGAVTRYGWFAMARMGVGVGEASLSPAAYSLIADLFRPSRVALAISVYSAAIFVGGGLSNIIGALVIGWAQSIDNLSLPLVGALQPWQFVFIAVGLPGLLFTFVVLILKEPIRRGLRASENENTARAIPFLQVFSYVGRNWQTVLFHNIGFGFCSFAAYGAAAWVPSLLIRAHGSTPVEVGIYYGSITAVFGTLGIVFGGWLAGRLADKGHEDSNMRVGFIAALAHVPLVAIYPLMPSATSVLVMTCPVVFTTAMCFGVAPAAIQQMMPNRMRGQCSAVYLFFVNLIGLGLGPSAVAWFTDYVYQDPEQVGMSLLWIGTISSVLATVLLYLGLRHFRVSMVNLRAWQAGAAIQAYSHRTMVSTLTLLAAGILGSAAWLVFG